jgi:hypothetical protein
MPVTFAPDDGAEQRRLIMRAATALAGMALALVAGGVAYPQSGRYVVDVRPARPEKGFERLTISKAALGTTPIELWKNAAINPDCTEVPGVSLSILQPPAHGKATVSDDPVYVAFPPANPRSACNNSKVPGHRAVYQADAGFTGHDKLVLQGSSPGGHVREVKVDILVR